MNYNELRGGSKSSPIMSADEFISMLSYSCSFVPLNLWLLQVNLRAQPVKGKALSVYSCFATAGARSIMKELVFLVLGLTVVFCMQPEQVYRFLALFVEPCFRCISR